MPRYLIEVPHDDEYHACQRALTSIVTRGAHFVEHAEWGCKDGVHTGWLIAEVADRKTARMIVPPELRTGCRVVQLNRWTRADVVATLEALSG
jgi:hypothetical protein